MCLEKTSAENWDIFFDTGELHFIVLERKGGFPYNSFLSYGDRIWESGIQNKNSSLKENRKNQDWTTPKELGDPSKVQTLQFLSGR